jgi:hypothetical protein
MFTRHARTAEEPLADSRLESVLDAAAAPAEPGPAPGEEAALAAFRAASVPTYGWRSRMHTPTTPLKSLGVAAASVGLVLAGGFASASAGVLPGAAQDAVQDMLGNIGVEVPGADDQSAGHADTRGSSADAPAGEAAAADSESQPDTHGQEVSDLARETELEGAEKGKAISELARSNGKAGEHGSGGAPEQPAAGGDDAKAREGKAVGGQSADQARVEAPNDGGTGTADDASTDHGGGASSNGTGTAGEMSGGRSANGSGNVP